MTERILPLVLLPGLDGTGVLFERFLAALPSELPTRVVTYPRDTPLSLAEHVAIARRAIGNDRVVLLAESFSGLVALQLLREGGVEVEKVIFVASFSSSPQPLLRIVSGILPVLARVIAFVPNGIWRRFCLGGGALDKDVRWLRGVVAGVRPSVIAHRLGLVAATHVSVTSPINIPAFYIEALGDKLVPRSAGESMQHLFREFTKVQLEGPHFLLQARPRECVAAVATIMNVVRG